MPKKPENPHELVYDVEMRHLWVMPLDFPLPSLCRWRR